MIPFLFISVGACLKECTNSSAVRMQSILHVLQPKEIIQIALPHPIPMKATSMIIKTIIINSTINTDKDIDSSLEILMISIDTSSINYLSEDMHSTMNFLNWIKFLIKNSTELETNFSNHRVKNLLKHQRNKNNNKLQMHHKQQHNKSKLQQNPPRLKKQKIPLLKEILPLKKIKFQEEIIS